jgi:thymidine kinase
MGQSKDTVAIGGAELYQPVCRAHFLSTWYNKETIIFIEA